MKVAKAEYQDVICDDKRNDNSQVISKFMPHWCLGMKLLELRGIFPETMSLVILLPSAEVCKGPCKWPGHAGIWK